MLYKKIFVFFCFLSVSLASFGQIFDVACSFGVSNDSYREPVINFDATVKNVVFGFGTIVGDVQHYNGPKTVSVKSYTRIQNGKAVTVKSHMRSKPNSGSGSVDLIPKELYVGYWVPLYSKKHFSFCTSFLVGANIINNPSNYNDSQKTELLYGGAFKMYFYNFGIVSKINSSSITFGISCVLR